VDNEDTAQLIGVDNVMYVFSGTVLKEMPWIERELKSLYQYCTGEELTVGLSR
jgi:hypothetical protein